jgi:hypothetical protein
LAAYGGTSYWGFYAGDAIAIFASIKTILFISYIEVSTFWFPGAYNKYVQLVLECIAVPLWLWAWSWLAAIAAVWDFGYIDCFDGIGDCSNGPASATKAAAGLGAIEWILFIGTLVTFGIHLHRHRRAEMQARQQGISGSAVVEEHKMGTVTQQPVYVQQQQQQQQPTGYNQAPVDPRYQNVNMA